MALEDVYDFVGRVGSTVGSALDSASRSALPMTRPPTTVQPRARGPQNPRARALPSMKSLQRPSRTSPRRVETMQGRRLPSATAGSAPQAGGQSVEAMLAEIRSRAQNEAAGLDAAYARDRDELMSRFQLSETPEERALLANALQNMTAQRDAGIQALGSGYAEARDRITGRAGEARDASAVEGQAAQQVYLDAASQLAGDTAGVAQGLQDTGLGAASAAPSTAAAQALLQANGASTGSLERQLGDIRAGDMDYLAESLAGEGLAQQGDLQRLALAAMADTEFKHGTRVQDRVANERLASAQMLAGLQGDYRGRGWDVADQDRDYLWRFAELGSRDRLARDELGLRQEQFDFERGQATGSDDPLTDLLGPEGPVRDLRILQLEQEFGPEVAGLLSSHGISRAGRAGVTRAGEIHASSPGMRAFAAPAPTAQALPAPRSEEGSFWDWIIPGRAPVFRGQ